MHDHLKPATACLALLLVAAAAWAQPADLDPATAVRWGTPGGWAVGPSPSVLESVIGSDDRVQILNTADDPWRRNAHLEVTFPLISTTCTGFFLGPDVVGTAGHCVYDAGLGGWVTNVAVIPGRNGTGGGSEPFGRQNAAQIFSTVGWVSSALPQFDYAALILPNGILGNQVTWYHIEAPSIAQVLGFTANIAGYPGDKPFGTQWYAFNPVTAAGDMVSYETDTFGGQSGSAVYRIGSVPRRYVYAIHAYGVSTPCNPGDNCGPRMRTEVADFFFDFGAPILSDNFESGDLSAWSSIVP